MFMFKNIQFRIMGFFNLYVSVLRYSKLRVKHIECIFRLKAEAYF